MYLDDVIQYEHGNCQVQLGIFDVNAEFLVNFPVHDLYTGLIVQTYSGKQLLQFFYSRLLDLGLTEKEITERKRHLFTLKHVCNYVGLYHK